LKEAEVVGVDAYVGSNKVAHGEITIPATDPVVLLYNRDPLRGVLYDAALPSAISLNAKEITIQAQPYFFSNKSVRSGTVTYNWTLNGEVPLVLMRKEE